MSEPPEQGPSPTPIQKSEWKKFIAGFGYAFAGLRYALRTQRNARVHVAIAIFALIMGLGLQISSIEFALLFFAISVVFGAELINTAIELCVDLVSPNYHPLAKNAKDVAAGAVLLSAILAVIIGLLIFVPHLWFLMTHH